MVFIGAVTRQERRKECCILRSSNRHAQYECLFYLDSIFLISAKSSVSQNDSGKFQCSKRL